jgi:hypothetical protein
MPLFMSGPSGLPLPSSPGTFNAPSSVTHHLIAQGFSPDEAELVYAAGVSGLITHEEWNAIKSGHMSFAEIVDTIFAPLEREHAAHLAGLGDLGDDPTYMDYSNVMQPPADPSSTYMDYSNVFTPPTFDAGSAPLIPINLTAGSQFPIPVSYSQLPNTLTSPAAAANPGTAASIAAGIQATGGLVQAAAGFSNPTQFTPAQVAALNAAAKQNAMKSFFTQQAIPGVPNVALLIAGGLALAMAAK